MSEISEGDDPFSLLGVPRGFAVDEKALEEKYLKLQSLWHPDLFINASERRRAEAQLNSCALNDAFETLKDPLKRSVCLLRLADHEAAAAEEGTIADPELLEEAMELRQALAETRGREQIAELATAQREKSRACLAELAAAFAANDLAKADKQTVKLRYLEKLSEEVRHRHRQLTEKSEGRR